MITNFLDRQYINKDNSQNPPKLPIPIFLPYIGLHTIRLKKNLIKFLGKIYPHIDFKFVFQSAKSIEYFFLIKDRARSHVHS